MKQTIERLIYQRMEALQALKKTYTENEWKACVTGVAITIDNLMDDLLEAGTLSPSEYQGLDDLLDTLVDVPY